MADDYLDTFEARGDLYNEASSINPRAREIEREILIGLLDIKPHHYIGDAPAGGGYLADGLRPLVKTPEQIVCVEPSAKFSGAIDPAYVSHIAPLDQLPIGNNSLDRVGSLAGLHHLADKSAFFREAFRVLKPGGIFAVGDVLEGTPVARFLNGPVDLYTATGHHGRFLRAGESTRLMSESGFVDVVEEHKVFSWVFQSRDQMVQYCRKLFGLVKASDAQVAGAIAECFVVEDGDPHVKLPWSLVYSVGVKR